MKPIICPIDDLSAPRNPFAIHAKKRKAGKIKSRKHKRKNGKNKQQELLKEND